MKQYSEQKLHYYQTSIEFGDDDTLCYQKRTPLSYSHEMIPLVQFAPEAQIIHKKLSTNAKWLMRVEAFLIMMFYISLVTDAASVKAVFNLTAMNVVIALAAITTVIYYYWHTRKYLYFCDFNFQKVLMILPYRPDDQNQQQLIKHFDIAVRNARVNIDQRNMNKLQKGIDTLQKQQIISQNFADVLRVRISHLTGTVI